MGDFGGGITTHYYAKPFRIFNIQNYKKNMKNTIQILLICFLLNGCVSIPVSTQRDIAEIKKSIDELKNDSSQSKTQISKLNESYQNILKGVVKPTSVVTNYDNLSEHQLDSLRAVRGLIKKN